MQRTLFCVTCVIIVGMMLCEPFLDEHREHVTYVAIAPVYSIPKEEHIPEQSFPTIPPVSTITVIGTAGSPIQISVADGVYGQDTVSVVKIG